MFAIVRTGGKQYRVAPGDKIVVEKLDGNAGDSVNLTDVLLAGEGSDLKSTNGLVVAAEIVAQAKAEAAEKPTAAPAKAEKPAAEKKAAAPKAEKAPAKKEAAPKATKSTKDAAPAKAATKKAPAAKAKK
jgi:large subunit ribosomal protein L21